MLSKRFLNNLGPKVQNAQIRVLSTFLQRLSRCSIETLLFPWVVCNFNSLRKIPILRLKILLLKIEEIFNRT